METKDTLDILRPRHARAHRRLYRAVTLNRMFAALGHAVLTTEKASDRTEFTVNGPDGVPIRAYGHCHGEPCVTVMHIGED